MTPIFDGARMTFLLSREKRKRLLPARLAIAALALWIGPQLPSHARGGAGERAIQSNETRNPGDPILAIVSLQKQRITVYDAQGWILRAPVSSGQRGRETPSGIFSVIQKDADHHSNLYDDAFMPHMQRLTWSGIALHGGPLPGYAASHGCVRMPYDFAEHLFDLTQLGLRVIVAPTDPSPVEISDPALLRPKPGAGALVLARNAEAADATAKLNQARQAAGATYREATAAMVPVRVAENQKLKAEAQLAAAETALTNATTDEARQAAEDAKAKATAWIADLQTQVDAAKAQLQVKADARSAARDAVAAAEAAQTAAAEAARQAARELEPVSVLISRKTQKLYVRQGFEPIFDAPITITDPDRPIGTYVFTAMERTGTDDDIRWTVVALEGPHSQPEAVEPRGRAAGRKSPELEQVTAAADEAKAALGRITIPQELLDRIPGVSPRSSVIITDEAPSPETSKGTDFVVVLSDQPQGGIKFRKPAPAQDYGYVSSRYRAPASGAAWGSPYGGRGFFTW
ncbi:MAG TPA: L,D-transpeptidase family protein [Bradyrhizobium sp.]|nr:L,D-transpeptidase family protein [Bradyrhizobium sp.]